MTTRNLLKLKLRRNCQCSVSWFSASLLTRSSGEEFLTQLRRQSLEWWNGQEDSWEGRSTRRNYLQLSLKNWQLCQVRFTHFQYSSLSTPLLQTSLPSHFPPLQPSILDPLRWQARQLRLERPQDHRQCPVEDVGQYPAGVCSAKFEWDQLQEPQSFERNNKWRDFDSFKSVNLQQSDEIFNTQCLHPQLHYSNHRTSIHVMKGSIVY